MMRWVLALFLGSAMALAKAQTGCLADAVAKAAQLVHQRQAELLQVRVEEMTTEVARPLQVQIRSFKNALAAAVDAEIACSPASEAADAMQARLAKALDANQPEKPFQSSTVTPDAKATDTAYDDKVYGADVKITVSTLANASELRAVQVSFGIECGDDTLLLLYESRRDGLHRILRWQSGDYKEISGAFGGFFLYSLIPGKDQQGWRLAVAHGTDWCTSRWSGFDVDVLAPASQTDTPRVVWHHREDFVIDSDPRMSSRPDGFDLRLDVGTIESEQMVRKGVFRYKIDGDRVERVAPIAIDGRGFVDAWLQASWPEAKQWSAPAGAVQFEAAHTAFERGHKDASVTYSYGPVRSCSNKGRYEVEIDATPGGPQFYAIQQGANGYTLVNYGTTQDDRCSGPDLMKKR